MLNNWVGDKGVSYFNLCWTAATDANKFKTFRRRRAYRRILEHVDKATGEKYLALISSDVIRRICLDSELADTLGSPRVHSYSGRSISPTTLRYGKVTNDLARLFPQLPNIERAVEIGIGYGGQARLLSTFLAATAGRLRSYTLIDLYPVLLLARQYLEHFELLPAFHYMTKSTIPRDKEWGIAISNYAFSEFNRALQAEYIRQILSQCQAGYLTMNTGLKPAGKEAGHTAEELVAMLPNAVVMPEEPNTFRGNYILVFGDHAARKEATIQEIRAASY